MNNLLLKLARSIAATRLANRLVEGVDLHSDNRMRERGMIAQAFEFKKINNISGDYFEFGLWRGKTFIYAHEMKRRYRFEEMRLWGFDSFEGLPPVADHLENIWHQGQFACSQIEFREIMKRAGLRENEYELIPGYYEHSLNQHLQRRLSGVSAAIVYIDCDLYVSARQALEFVRPHLINGSVICFDDFYNYGANPQQGEQKALTEFLEKHDDLLFLDWFDYSPLGKSFIVRLR